MGSDLPVGLWFTILGWGRYGCDIMETKLGGYDITRHPSQQRFEILPVSAHEALSGCPFDWLFPWPHITR